MNDEALEYFCTCCIILNYSAENISIELQKKDGVHPDLEKFIFPSFLSFRTKAEEAQKHADQLCRNQP